MLSWSCLADLIWLGRLKRWGDGAETRVGPGCKPFAMDEWLWWTEAISSIAPGRDWWNRWRYCWRYSIRVWARPTMPDGSGDWQSEPRRIWPLFHSLSSRPPGLAINSHRCFSLLNVIANLVSA